MIYTWQKAVVENAARAFDGAGEQKVASSREAELARRVEQLSGRGFPMTRATRWLISLRNGPGKPRSRRNDSFAG
jgi:hypothetical protein